MATVDPKPAADGAQQQPPAGPSQKKHRSRWIWVSALLGLACAGLLIWALVLRSDLDDANAQNAQNAQKQETGGKVAAAAKAAYDSLAAELGATTDDLDATQQELEGAQQDADQAQKAADEATQTAESTDDKLDTAVAEADQAKAEAEAAGSKATVAKDCAKAYVSALGGLLDGGQKDQVRAQLQGITSDCQAAFAGS
jgi:hypothetical protein